MPSRPVRVGDWTEKKGATRPSLWLVICCCLVGGSVHAQTTGDLRGAVSDESGGVLPGASVIIRSDALIGGPQSSLTNQLGVYRFPALPVGEYSVEVTLDGFIARRVDNVRIGLDATASVDVVLTVAGVATTVTVVGAPPALDTTDSGMSNVHQVREPDGGRAPD
jgi:hypothetical protein